MRPRAVRRSPDPVLISTAMMPCPGAGTHDSAGRIAEIRSCLPRRLSPAAARINASKSPASTFLNRVSRLPRIAANVACGNNPRSWAARRTLGRWSSVSSLGEDGGLIPHRGVTKACSTSPATPCSRPAISYVIQAGPTFKLLAVNPMGEICMATPAISEGTLYFRTQGHVVAIAD